MMELQCSKCKVVKSYKLFSKNKRSKTGHSNWCKECSSKQSKIYYSNNSEIIKNRSSSWYEKNKEKATLRIKKRYSDKKEQILEYHREWHLKNKQKANLNNKEWRQKNKEQYLMTHSKSEKNRRKRIKMATPSWVSKKEINDFYVNKPEGMTVDHIVPICGKNVCGLHVIWNLQYLTMEQNLKKGCNLVY